MKTTWLPQILTALVLPMAALGCTSASVADDSSSQADVTADPCVRKVTSAAETEYGDAPHGTHVKVLTAGTKYRVTVGIGNTESGAHDYYVTFHGACATTTPAVAEVPMVAPPLQGAAHTAYDRIFAANGNTIPATYAMATEGALPTTVKRQLVTWRSPVHGSCTTARAYEIPVSGQSTFAITCDIARGSIRQYVLVYDSDGGDVDEASIYHASTVGTNGVSWQDAASYQQD